MWSTIKEAMKQFAPHRDKLFAVAYSLPWPPAIKEKASAVLQHIYRTGIAKVRLNTPSIGQYWPTHPTFAYDNGRTVFVKAGPVGVIEREYQNLMLLKKYGVSVATPLGVYVTPENLYEEDALMSPGVIHGALMIEEFLHSLRRRGFLDGVFLEGAYGRLKPQLFRFFPDRERNAQCAELMIQEGELSGAERQCLQGWAGQ